LRFLEVALDFSAKEIERCLELENNGQYFYTENYFFIKLCLELFEEFNADIVSQYSDIVERLSKESSRNRSRMNNNVSRLSFYTESVSKMTYLFNSINSDGSYTGFLKAQPKYNLPKTQEELSEYVAWRSSIIRGNILNDVYDTPIKFELVPEGIKAMSAGHDKIWYTEDDQYFIRHPFTLFGNLDSNFVRTCLAATDVQLSAWQGAEGTEPDIDTTSDLSLVYKDATYFITLSVAPSIKEGEELSGNMGLTSRLYGFYHDGFVYPSTIQISMTNINDFCLNGGYYDLVECELVDERLVDDGDVNDFIANIVTHEIGHALGLVITNVIDDGWHCPSGALLLPDGALPNTKNPNRPNEVIIEDFDDEMFSITKYVHFATDFEVYEDEVDKLLQALRDTCLMYRTFNYLSITTRKDKEGVDRDRIEEKLRPNRLGVNANSFCEDEITNHKKDVKFQLTPIF